MEVDPDAMIGEVLKGGNQEIAKILQLPQAAVEKAFEEWPILMAGALEAENSANVKSVEMPKAKAQAEFVDKHDEVPKLGDREIVEGLEGIEKVARFTKVESRHAKGFAEEPQVESHREERRGVEGRNAQGREDRELHRGRQDRGGAA